MMLTISGRDINVRQDLREITEKRAKRLEKFFSSNTEISVIYSKKRNKKCAEITAIENGTFYRGEVDGDTFNNSLDEAIDIIVRQIRKHKTKLERRLRADAFIEYQDDFDLDEPAQNIRVKTFKIKPMTVDEAILQMELLEHTFFVFKDADTSETCVVYKRKDGDYGLIVPQL